MTTRPIDRELVDLALEANASRDLGLSDDIRDWNTRQTIARRTYHTDPFGGARELNKTDQAAERMAASRAAKKVQP